MRTYTIHASRIIEAPIEIVWDLVADARSYRAWTVLPTSTLEHEGAPTPDGVGAVRNFGIAPFISREEVVVFDPPTHLGYVLLSGLPIESYRADVRLDPLDDRRTRVTWKGTFESGGLNGKVMERLISSMLSYFVRRLGKAALQRR